MNKNKHEKKSHFKICTINVRPNSILGTTIVDKIYEKISSFMCNTGKTLISIFQQFSASIKKKLVWVEDWALGYNYMKF